MDLGKRLKGLRNKAKLSQKDLAEKLGINRVTYSQYEINRRVPDIDTLQKIADFYGVSLDFLTGRSGSHEVNNENEYLDNDIRAISRAVKNMTPDQRKKMRLIAETLFAEDDD